MSKIKVNIERTPAQVELVKKLGSRNKVESMAAAEAIASILPQPILQVILQAAVFSSLYTVQTYDSNSAPTIDLDPFFDLRARNAIQTWSQTMAGGTATNFIQGLNQLYVHTFPLTSAVSMNKSTLRSANLDYLGASLTRMAQEILVQMEDNAAKVLMSSLAGARIDFDTANTAATNLTLARTVTQGQFSIADFNRIMTKYDRVISSNMGGTPVGDRGGIDVLIGSPEWIGEIRALSYQPVNTRNGATTTSGASSLAAPDALREEILRNAGVQSFFGIELRKAWELGAGRIYNQAFKDAIGSTAILGYNDSGTAAFTAATEQVVVGLNSNMFDLLALRQSEGGNEILTTPDDTFTLRSDKVGFFSEVKTGFVSCDSRSKFGIIY